MKKTFILVFLCISWTVQATNYYVKNGGNNSLDGKSDANAWATISKVNGISFLPGDSILFRKGDVWREKLSIISSGSGGKYITFGSYGTGAKPQILGSTKAITWTAEGHANIWVSATTVSDPSSLGMSGSDIFFNSSGTIKQGYKKTYSSTFANLTAEYNWTWSASKIYVYSPSDPSTRYTAVEVPQIDWGISINEKEYIMIDGFEIHFGCSGGITTASYPTANKSYLTIKNCEVSYSGLVTPNTIPDVDNYGIHACYSHMLLQNNVVHDMGRRSISIYNYGSGFTTTDIVIEGNTLYNGFHTTGIDISCGSGGAGSADFDGIIIRNNLVYDDVNSFNYGSEDLNIESYYTAGVNIHNVLIHNNIIKNVQNSGIHIYGVKGADIFNNTFYGHNVNASGNIAQIKIQNECTDVVIKNNIFYTPLNVESNSRGNAIYTSSTQTTASITADYNIYYRVDPTFRIIELKGGATIYRMNQIANIRSGLGWETHGQVIDPKFISSADYHLQTGSPGIGAGIAIPEVNSDYDGNPFQNPPNIGCFTATSVTTDPVFLSAIVENATPTLLEATYNLTLANIVPAASSFTVVVNSVNRTVSSVAISGTKVRLTLSSPVLYGDVVTVAYTKPATNPLQTSTGGQAASFTASAVTNNVNPAAPTYVSSVIENATPTLLEATYNLTLANIVPAASSFTVVVNSVNRTVSSVAISGTKVRLTLSSPVLYGDVVTVAYTKPATNPLQTSTGGQAASFTASAVTNNVNPAAPTYVSSVIENATPTLLEATYNLTLANIVPAASSFTVVVNSVNRTVSSVAISGTKVRLTLSSPVLYGDVVTVAYTKPATNPLQTSTGGQAASFTASTVTNNVNPAAPTYVSSVIENATPTLLEATYNLTLANIVPAASSFTVVVNSVNRTVGSVTISGTKVRLTLSSPVLYGDVVTVAYTKPATNPLQTSTGGQAASFTASAVTNNANPAAPTYVSSVIENATPTLLEATYNLTLANIVPAASSFTVVVNSVNRTVGSVTISGTKVRLTLSSPVLYGDVVTVAYTKPATNPLQTSTGGQAASFTASAVTNNVNPAAPTYVSSVIENATPTLLEATYNLTLANIVPAASSFTVVVNSVNRTVGSVTISGTKVRLTLSSPVLYGDVVTVAYTKPATNPLQTSTGGQAASFTASTVTNNVNPAAPTYVSSVIENATPTLLEATYNLTLANIVPAASSFTVVVNSVNRTVGSVTISGTKVRLTLSSPVLYGDVVTVAYTKPATNPLQTSTGGQAASFTASTVTNNVNPAAPTYVSSVIENATPTLLEATYNLTLANIVPAASSFTVVVNSVNRTVGSVTISGTKVRLTLSSPVLYGDVVTVAYSKPAVNPLQTASGGQAATITAQSVTNSVAAVPLPVYQSSVVTNATPSVVEMTYSLTLANIVPSTSSFIVMVNSVARSVNSVAVSGTKVSLTLSAPVIYGDVITVAYTKPATNPLQTASGGQAATITAQSVTNSVAAVPLPVYQSSVVTNATPSVVEMTYSLTLANIVPSTSSFIVMVNSVARSVNSVAVSGTKVSLTLSAPVIYGDVITVVYTKPASNPLQTSLGGQASNTSAQYVLNSCITSSNQPPIVSITSPLNNSTVKAPGNIEIIVDAYDSDGTILKVEFFNGSIKIGERTIAPYSITWRNVPRGKYSITAVATDNLSSKKVSTPLIVTVRTRLFYTKGAPVTTILEPGDGKHFTAPAKIGIAIDSYDPDSIICKVEYFAGTTKIGESIQAPYSISFERRTAGSFTLTSIAYDEFDEIVTSSFSDVYIDESPESLSLYPNPNDGRFSVEPLIPLQDKESIVKVINMTGKTVYQGTWSSEENIKQFDLSHLDSGIYVFIISSHEILFTKKFIKK